MTPLRARSPVAVGVVGTVVLALALLATVVVPRLPMFDGQTPYRADLAQAAGLQPGDEVRVAGVHAGFVKSMQLHDQVIRVDFTTDSGLRLGRDTTVSVGVATILGRMYLAVQPKGSGRLSSHALIPLRRTAVPYTLPEIEHRLDETTQNIDVAQLQKALTTLSDTFTNTPELTKSTLTGVSRLSQVVASRREQLGTLLSRTKQVTQTLSAQRQQLLALLGDGDLVLQEVTKRREAIHALLLDTTALSRQLTTLVDDNQGVIGPLLADLKTVADTLRKDDESLKETVLLLGPASRYLANAFGNGPWLDVLVPNLVVPDNVLCQAQLAGECK